MEALIISILSGFAVSGLFLIFLSQLRPNIVISPEISVRESENDICYVIKVINKGKRSAINIKAELSRVKIRIVPDGQIHSTKKISLRKSEIFSLSKINPNEKESNYAYRFSTGEDVDSLWADDSIHFFRIRIYAQDEISGFGKVFTQEYRTKRITLIPGEFRHGNSLEIV